MLNMSVLPPEMLIGPNELVAKCLSERGTGNIPGDGDYSMLSERTLSSGAQAIERRKRRDNEEGASQEQNTSL